MSTDDRVQVALFIDWDNLAISTAADLGGAMPDVKAVVQRAQQYGTVIMAKAYAEWQATSDRLSVYRAGVDPVYAPTFRFEPDTATQQGKGKSLADPCMVADCVDALHLFPGISVYVIVTGDKDMVPVVRLAQLRGRKVVVIGPDYVAGVLREMADEFIPYRSLVETTPSRPPTEPVRRHAPAHAVTDETSRRRAPERRPLPATYVRPDKPMPLATVAPAPVPTPTPAPPPMAARGRPSEPVEVGAEVAEERAQPEDLRTVYARITDILRQRSADGRDRIRATNLKDALMQRLPGFSERKYGFAKFKDMLGAAEKTGLIQVTMAGPVHWISLPQTEEQKQAAEAVAALAALPIGEPAQAREEAPVPVEERRNEMIRFIYELRDRSRWLTYTYVLTNLISHFAKSLPQAAAESEARATLNYLVQEGILRVDKEPQEVEVGGAKHRVRMCHLNADHALVADALGFRPDEGGPEAAEAERPEETTEEELGTGAGAVAGIESEAVPQTGLPVEEAPIAETSGEHFDGLVGGNGSVVSTAPIGEENIVIAQPAPEEAPAAGELAGEEAAPEGAVPAWQAPEGQAAEQPVTGVRENLSAKPGLEQAYAALERVVFDATSGEKPVISASTLRGRLAHALGSFNERRLGFSRFKDFLLAAQQAGIVRVESRGYVTWVSLPAERTRRESPAVPDDSGQA